MYELRAIRLINWYHFTDVTLPVVGSCLLLGDNGSGKSTVLDAVQLALVGDLTEVRFNKAANEHSRRTAHAYVRGKLGSEDESRPGQVRYTRDGACTGYVMLEFAPTAGGPSLLGTRLSDSNAPFVVGLVIDASGTDTSVQKGYFIVPNAGSAEIPAVTETRLVRPMREFRAAIRAVERADYSTDAASYRGKLRQRLGPVPETFHRLIAKGLEFKPMGQVRDFVMNYLADPIAIHTAPLLANLEHYKGMEREAQAAEERIVALDAICEQGEKVRSAQRTLESHRYVALRADVDVRADAELDAEEACASNERLRAAAAAAVQTAESKIRTLEDEERALANALAKSDAYQARRRAQDDLERVQDDLKRAQDAEAEARKILALQTEALDALLSDDARGVRRAWTDEQLFPDQALFGSSEAPERIAQLRKTLVADGTLTGGDLRAWTERLGTARKQVDYAGYRLTDVHGRLTEQDQELREELKKLDAGRVQYPSATEALLHLLRTKLQSQRRTPQPICELLEIRNERWRDAVEGVLGLRRFDILVAPEDFQRAAQLYERYRDTCELPRRGVVRLFGVSVIDIGRIIDRRPSADASSLATQVETSDQLARAYINHALGRVICCDDVSQLRQHEAAVTDTVMIYQGFAVRRPDPKTYAQPVIGAGARERRRAAVENELAVIAETLRGIGDTQLVLQRVLGACQKALAAAGRFPDLAAAAAGLRNLRWQKQELERRIEDLDTSEVADLEAQYDAARARLDAARDEKDKAVRSEGEYKGLAAGFATQREAAYTAYGRAVDALADAFPTDPPGRWDTYERSYENERAKPRPALEIRDAFDHQRKIFEGRVGNLVPELVRLKERYNQRYGSIGESLGDGFDDYVRERDVWRDSRLPEYREKMASAREQALEQLAEDIVSKLGANFAKLEREFAELNRALRDVLFGADRYRFMHEPEPSMREFYDLIKEASRYRLDRGSLFGDQVLPPHLRETLDAMVTRLVRGPTTEVKDELEMLTDYREYFRYDLRIEHADGTRSSYNAVAGEKSGGETQTPYYIAILASMHQMYRSLLPERRPRCGVVLFDEAFSKMDGPRIEATLAFARGLGLQLIVATPKEKVDLVARHVGTSLLIHKDPVSNVPAIFDCTRDLADGAERDVA
jgi:uncharacterized protein YPO0396